MRMLSLLFVLVCTELGTADWTRGGSNGEDAYTLFLSTFGGNADTQDRSGGDDELIGAEPSGPPTVFLTNYANIETVNNQNKDYKLAVNQFADLTAAEVIKIVGIPEDVLTTDDGKDRRRSERARRRTEVSYGPAQPSYFCYDNWSADWENREVGLNVDGCKDRCSHDSNCFGIVYGDFGGVANNCAKCTTIPTRSDGSASAWGTYYKKMDGSAPSSLDWRNSAVPVKNQASCGSCWAFAATAALENRMFHWGYLREYGDLTDVFSNQEMVDCVAPERAEHGCYGGWTHRAYEHVEKFGLSKTSDYPYEDGDFLSRYPEGSEYTGPRNCRESQHSRNIQAGQFYGGSDFSVTDDEIVQLLQDGPITVSIRLNESWIAYSSGVFSDDTCKDTVDIGGHAVVIVGYTPDYWIVQNSWAATWGDGGFIKMKRGMNICGMNWFGVSWMSKEAKGCNMTRSLCCRYISAYNMVPFVTWGTTPDFMKQPYVDNNCNAFVGGQHTPNCPYTCSGCVDNNVNCPYWASIGECAANPAYMLHHCRYSCDVCAGDDTNDYAPRVASTYCSANWDTVRLPHWDETFTLEECKNMCTSSSTCNAISYGSKAGNWPGYCVLCDDAGTRETHADWELYVKGSAAGAVVGSTGPDSLGPGDRVNDDEGLVIGEGESEPAGPVSAPATPYDCSNPGYFVYDKTAAFKKGKKEKKKLLIGWSDVDEAICECTTHCYNGGYGFWSVAAKKKGSDCVCMGEEAKVKKVKNRAFTGKKRYVLGSLSETAEAKLRSKIED